MSDAVRALEARDPVGRLQVLRRAHLLDDLQSAPHAHRLQPAVEGFDRTRQGFRIAGTVNDHPQVFGLRRELAQGGERAHAFGDLLALLVEGPPFAQLDPDHDSARRRVPVKGDTRRIRTPAAQGREHLEENLPQSLPLSPGPVEKADNATHVGCLLMSPGAGILHDVDLRANINR